MPSTLLEIIDELTPHLRAGNLARCEERIAESLDAMPDTPFHIATAMAISNDPADAAAHIDRFIAHESKRFTIAAVYVEMNGSDINTDRWFFDLFAYDAHGGHNDYDWLADWRSDEFDGYTITGLEDLQAIYARESARDETHADARDMCTLLVVLKFQRFIDRAVKQSMRLHCPLLATAHDFDFISESLSEH